MSEKNKTQSNSVRGIEIFGHAIGGVGQNMVYVLWSGFITAFYTDIFGMNPAVMATIFVVARVWDAFNDPMMGIIADRTRSKYGRYRCWLLRMPIVVATCLILNFTVPHFGNVGNIVYAVVTYILMGMAFTSVDIPYWSMPAAMTSDPNERTKIFTTANLGTNIASTVGNMLVPILLVSFGGTNSAHAYFMTAVIFAVIGAALYLTCFALTREHVQPSTQKFSFRLAVKSLAVNKPLFCIMITNLVINLAFIMKMTLNYYYTTYTLGNVKLMSVMSLVTLPSIIFGTCIAPLLAKKLGKKRTVLVLMVTNLIVSGIFFFGGYSSIPFVLVMGALQILCVGAAFVMLSSMTADTIEYGEWKTGQRNEGIITSTRTLITKIASALVGVAVAVVLTMTGYVPNVEQSESTMHAFHFVISFLPGIVMMIGAVPIFFYSLTESKHLEIMEELKKRRESEEK
ncbi:MFS transporter [Sporofaciens musculi]|jgi:sugar (Glycoside-Pentoside-Hexuronide) transporter|uniref:MFS transporter n=1 Tax=Sporofaciens musculi TaxID=2681861 RepID=UPI00259C93C9|nr:glycoside-pentoside-hexuronide (GPH):cation symporter [Sporofaciens musculi]